MVSKSEVTIEHQNTPTVSVGFLQILLDWSVVLKFYCFFWSYLFFKSRGRKSQSKGHNSWINCYDSLMKASTRTRIIIINQLSLILLWITCDETGPHYSKGGYNTIHWINLYPEDKLVHCWIEFIRCIALLNVCLVAIFSEFSGVKKVT